MPRARTTKGLAKRIELTYYRRLHPFRWWWRVLCLAVPGAGLLWLGVMAVLGDQRIYTSGRVAVAHRMFDAACERCHVEVPRPPPPAPAGDGARSTTPPSPRSEPPAASSAARPAGAGFFRRVSDGACLACHDGPVHHDTQTFEPSCVSCHVEHRGEAALVRVSDRHCTWCHADLRTRTGEVQFERRIVSLAAHPEFALFRSPRPDPTQLKLNHETHLREGLPAGGGRRVTLTCESCHQPDAAGRYLRPVVYETHCAECHPLEAGEGLVVPHEAPELLRGFLLARLGGRGPVPAMGPARERPEPPAVEPPEGRPRRRPGAGARLGELAELVRLEPSAWLLAQRRRPGAPEEPPAAEPAPPGRRRPGAGPEEPAAEPPAARRRPGAPAGETPAPERAPGVPAAVAAAERELFEGRTGCRYCHTLEGGEGGLPRVVPPRMPDRWLLHSRFDHRAHRALTCLACHGQAATSVETADVLVPRIQTCRECHRPAGGARSDCVECHVYHDPARGRPSRPLTMPEFVGGRPAPARPVGR